MVKDVTVEGVVVLEDGVDAAGRAVRDRGRLVPYPGCYVLGHLNAMFMNQYVVQVLAHPFGLYVLTTFPRGCAPISFCWPLFLYKYAAPKCGLISLWGTKKLTIMKSCVQVSLLMQALLQVLSELFGLFDILSIGSALVHPTEVFQETIGVKPLTTEFINDNVTLGSQFFPEQ